MRSGAGFIWMSFHSILTGALGNTLLFSSLYRGGNEDETDVH